MYWDDESFFVEPYERKQKKYHCGKKLLRIEKDKAIKLTILVIDLDEACCANIYTDGDVEKLFHFNSEVPHKHHAGGQSAQRFARIRESAITLYFKKINDKLKNIDVPLKVGINFVYKNRFEESLSTPNKNKIIGYETTEYGGESGVYQIRQKYHNI